MRLFIIVVKSMNKRNAEPKVPRSHTEMIEELRSDIHLLREYEKRAFTQGEEDFYGEVAGKLRVLVHEKGANTPLLLRLMDEYKIEIPVEISWAWGSVERMTLREYLDMTAFEYRIPERGLVPVKNKHLIEVWSQQKGASHKDWSLDEVFASALASGLILGDIPAAARSLRNITSRVLLVADEFLEQFKAKK